MPHFCKLLYKLGFDRGGNCPPTRTEAMKGVVKSNGQGEPEFHNAHQRLPQDLNESNASDVTTSLGNDYSVLPYALF